VKLLAQKIDEEERLPVDEETKDLPMMRLAFSGNWVRHAIREKGF